MPAIVLEAKLKLLNFWDMQKAIFFSKKKFNWSQGCRHVT